MTETRAEGVAVELSGLVQRQRVDLGSKSEREALVLIDDQGQAHRLRRQGGNPFADPVLQGWEGQRLRLQGEPRDGYFLIHSWELLPS
ncbi:hypothetical protein RQP53_15665 [Paucibacter sp. APW11]|uniref:Uncharacterized protein n=1 Tax=Roseateles aquae TaxID=3077235 RepID=A0ABU3PDQ9_9BURK|nr:hypothetical protein [Paucibacter sp. APW11]MDT9000713.1 hypothetical protein [Paucibacter sp. APW11]